MFVSYPTNHINGVKDVYFPEIRRLLKTSKRKYTSSDGPCNCVPHVMVEQLYSV